MVNQFPRYYQSIKELPLNKYIDCQVNKNLSALVISGFPSPEALQSAWINIQYEYAEATGDNEMKVYAGSKKDIALLSCTLQQVEMCAVALRDILKLEGYSDEIEEIKDKWAFEMNALLKTSFKFDFYDKQTYLHNLQRCINRSKAFKIDMDLKKSKFEAIQKKFEKGTAPDETYFMNLLITLSDACGYSLRDDITVFEFCERIKRLNNVRGINK